MEALVSSFARWKGDKDRKGPYPERTSRESLADYAKNHNLPPPPRSITLIADLPTVSIADLPDEQQRCSICLESYIKDEFDESIPENPTRLPCGHVVGHRCLRSWVFPYGDGEYCPVCRADCLLEDLGWDMDGMRYRDSNALEIAIDEMVWADHEGGRPLSHAERAKVKRDRYCIVKERLAEAWKELNDDCESFGLAQHFGGADERGLDTIEDWMERVILVDQMAKEVAAAFRAYEGDLEGEGSSVI